MSIAQKRLFFQGVVVTLALLACEGVPERTTPTSAAPASTPQVAPATAAPITAPVDVCGLGPGEPEDDDRVVLLGHPFGDQPGTRGNEIRSMVLRSDGTLVDVGTRLDLGSPPERIVFTPSGRFALVAGKDGLVTLVEVLAPDELIIRDVVSVDPQGTADLVIHPDGRTAWLVRRDVRGATSGIFTITIGCEGSLHVVPGHFGLRLAEALALFPGDPDHALLLGGQAVFYPVDDADLRLLVRDGETWRAVGAYDIFHDAVQASGIAVSPDGRTAVVPNASAFSDEGNQVVVLDVHMPPAQEPAGSGGLVERQRLRAVHDAALARFSPDGATVVLVQPEAGQISLLAADAAGHYRVVSTLAPGLATDLAIVQRGAGTGLMVVPSVHPRLGSRVQVYRLEGPGRARLVDAVDLSAGHTEIPAAIGIRP